MNLDRYRDWLASHWSLSINLDHAVRETIHDPWTKSRSPEEHLGLPDAVRGEDIRADHSTAWFIRAMRREKSLFRGKSTWEIGCGNGLIAVESGLLGATRVCASDIDEEAVQLARENGSIHGIDIEAVQADLFSGIPWTEPFDLLLSVLPQKPCEPGQLPLANDGGPEGTSLLLPVIREAPSRLADSGHLLLFLHSLAHPEALVSLHQQYDVEVLSITERIFSREEFPGLIDQWEKRRERNACYFEEQPHARLGFTCMILKARPKR